MTLENLTLETASKLKKGEKVIYNGNENTPLDRGNTYTIASTKPIIISYGWAGKETVGYSLVLEKTEGKYNSNLFAVNLL
jgi:hypothetical protein